MTKKEFNTIVQLIADQLVGFLVEDYNMPVLEAFDKIYNSQTFQNLQDKNTGLYLRSAAYNYEYIKKELE